MSTPVLMPQMGESIAEGTIVRWIKKVGDAVDRDEPLFEISTDKVDAEIPSPAAGVLAEIKVKEGETVAVNSVVATIGEPGARRGGAAAERRAAVAAGAAPQPQPDGSPSPRSAPARTDAPAPSATAGRGRPVAAPAAGMERLGERRGRAVEGRAAPREVVAARAQDREGARRRHPQIQGTGIGGRVTKHDILGFIEHGAAAAPSPTPRRAGEPRADRSHAGVQGRRVGRSRADERDAQEDRRAHGGEPRTSPHVHSVFEVNFTRVAQLREQKKAEYERAGAKLTYMSFITKAVVDALRAVPDRQRLGRRRQRRLQEGHQPRHRGGARLGAHRAGDEERRREEPARPEPRDRRSREPRAREEAEARRSAGRNLHDHQPRHLRRAVRAADHQPAAGRDPRRRRHREARRRDRRCDRDQADGLPGARASTTG